MNFFNALNLIRVAAEENILIRHGDYIAVYRSAGNPSSEHPEGWGMENILTLAGELMSDEEGQQTLIAALEERGVKFEEIENPFNFALEQIQRQGYEKAIEDINEPALAIQKEWSPSKCPRCDKSFEQFEPCNDGYYKRATSMQRCPYCGQLLDWSAS